MIKLANFLLNVKCWVVFAIWRNMNEIKSLPFGGIRIGLSENQLASTHTVFDTLIDNSFSFCFHLTVVKTGGPRPKAFEQMVSLFSNLDLLAHALAPQKAPLLPDDSSLALPSSRHRLKTKSASKKIVFVSFSKCGKLFVLINATLSFYFVILCQKFFHWGPFH